METDEEVLLINIIFSSCTESESVVVSEIVVEPQAGSSVSNDSLQWNFTEVTDDDVEAEYSYAAACSTPVTSENEVDAEKLIEAVRNREALWDLSSSDYKNRMLRPNLWREVAREISYNESKVSNLRKRWDGIKSAYMRAKAGVPSGSCATGKEYKYARLLSFLDDKYEPRSTMSTMDSPSASTDNSSNVPHFEIPHTPKRKAHSECMAMKRRALEVIESRAVRSESAEDSFGNFIAQEMKSLPEPYKAELQLDIMRSLFNIKKKIHDL